MQIVSQKPEVTGGEPVFEVQPGPQTLFVASSADITVYGGSAGSGKTFGLLLDPLRWIETPGFNSTMFRRTSPQIRQPGGLWSESKRIYPFMGGVEREGLLDWRFAQFNSEIRFSHMENENDKDNWYGAQICHMGWDELITFTEAQFWFLVSRSRSTCGVKPRIKATTNPDPDSWVRNLIAWWLDLDRVEDGKEIEGSGYARPERAGKIRWCYRVGDALHWFDSKREAFDFARGASILNPVTGEPIRPKSLTFIPATIYDNVELLKRDPQYLANLYALPYVERMRLLGEGRQGGNWKVRPTAGKVFNLGWFEIVDAVPVVVKRVRYWDLAATPDGDFTCGVRMSKTEAGLFYVEDVVRGQWGPFERDKVILQTAQLDGSVPIWIEEEPGSAGKSVSATLIKMLAGHTVHSERPTGDKYVRSQPFAAQAEAGNVKLLRGQWNRAYVDELHAFPDGAHDDQVDASSAAFLRLAGKGRRMFETEGNEVRRQQEQGVPAPIPGVSIQRIDDVYEQITVNPSTPADAQKAQEGWTFNDILRRR